MFTQKVKFIINGKTYYAIRWSFFGLFKKYRDLRADGFYWQRDSRYFRDCLGEDPIETFKHLIEREEVILDLAQPHHLRQAPARNHKAPRPTRHLLLLDGARATVCGRGAEWYHEQIVKAIKGDGDE